MIKADAGQDVNAERRCPCIAFWPVASGAPIIDARLSSESVELTIQPYHPDGFHPSAGGARPFFRGEKMVIIPALDWLLAHWRGDPAAAPCAPLPLSHSAAEARVNAELPLQKRRSCAALLGSRELTYRAKPPLAALLRPTGSPGPQGLERRRPDFQASIV